MRPDDTPLPVQSEGRTFEEHREQLRGAYCQAISDIVDRVLSEVILPDEQATICLDVAQFTTFMMAVKIAEVRGLQPTKENLMKWYWPMQKALKDEVPGMLRELAQAATGPAQGRA